MRIITLLALLSVLLPCETRSLASEAPCSDSIRLSIDRSREGVIYLLDGNRFTKFPLGKVADKLSACSSKRRLEITLSKNTTDKDLATAANAVQKLQAENAHIYSRTDHGLKEIKLPPISEAPPR